VRSQLRHLLTLKLAMNSRKNLQLLTAPMKKILLVAGIILINLSLPAIVMALVGLFSGQQKFLVDK
jgi:hypothetical protein